MMEENVLPKAYDAGFAFERDFGGCAQCVIGGLYELFPELRNEDIFRSASALGGGVGLTTKSGCGALAGAAMIISQMTGRSLENVADPERKRFVAYRFGEKLVNKFLDEYGTVTCEKIQEKLMGRSFYMYEEWDEFLAAGGHTTACTSVVGNATRWAAEIICDLNKK